MLGADLHIRLTVLDRLDILVRLVFISILSRVRPISIATMPGKRNCWPVRISDPVQDISRFFSVPRPSSLVTTQRSVRKSERYLFSSTSPPRFFSASCKPLIKPGFLLSHSSASLYQHSCKVDSSPNQYSLGQSLQPVFTLDCIAGYPNFLWPWSSSLERSVRLPRSLSSPFWA